MSILGFVITTGVLIGFLLGFIIVFLLKRAGKPYNHRKKHSYKETEIPTLTSDISILNRGREDYSAKDYK